MERYATKDNRWWKRITAMSGFVAISHWDAYIWLHFFTTLCGDYNYSSKV